MTSSSTRFGDRGEATGVDELAEKLRVVNNVVVAADLWVLALEGVQAVRAGDHDLGRLDLVEHLDVLHAPAFGRGTRCRRGVQDRRCRSRRHPDTMKLTPAA